MENFRGSNKAKISIIDKEELLFPFWTHAIDTLMGNFDTALIDK